MAVRLPVTLPWDGARLLRFLGTRAITGVETHSDAGYRRTIRTPSGCGVVTLRAVDEALHVHVTASDVGVVGAMMTSVRRMCDLSADIAAIEAVLGSHRRFAPMVRRRPGLRVPGAVSGWEILVRAIVGQQVSVAAARTLLSRIVARCGMDVPVAFDDGAHRLFPEPDAVADADLESLGLTGRRRQTLRTAARSVAEGQLLLEPGDDLVEARRRLLALPGVGPWTAEYVAMRALADPDAWPATDLVLARAASGLNIDRLSPWRSYAAVHLWTRDGEERT